MEAAPSSSDSLSSSSPTTPKKRKIHMNVIDCRDYLETEGYKRLTNPATVKLSSKSPNCGLYPRSKDRNLPRSSTSTMGSGFTSATQVLNPKLPFVASNVEPSQSHPSTSGSPAKKRGPKYQSSRAKFPIQTNKLDKYFTKISKTENSDSNDGILSQMPTKCVKTTLMYSPIKKQSQDDPRSSVYVLDDDAPLLSTPEKMCSSGVEKLEVKHKKTAVSKHNKWKKIPKFNRDNTFLYSNNPVIKPAKSDGGDKYGLLGHGNVSDDDDDDARCWFDYLPPEVLQNILCRLPLMDLYLNVNTVCKQWNEIISDTKVCHGYMFVIYITGILVKCGTQ